MKKSLKKVVMVVLLIAALGVPAVLMMGAQLSDCDNDSGVTTNPGNTDPNRCNDCNPDFINDPFLCESCIARACVSSSSCQR